MKKLVIATLFSVLAVSNASAFFGLGGRGCCPRATRCAAPCPVECEPAPVCYKMVRKECPARKICHTKCHYECPPDTIREECNGDNGY